MANAINSLNFGGNTYAFTLPYGVCSTASDVAEKVVTVPNFSVENGARILVRFDNTNTSQYPTLNVNGSGAIPIALGDMTDFTSNNIHIDANRSYEFVLNITETGSSLRTTWDLLYVDEKAAPFVVTISGTGPRNYVADKTFDEIYSAYLENKRVIANITADDSAYIGYIYELAECSSTHFVFVNTTVDSYEKEVWSDSFIGLSSNGMSIRHYSHEVLSKHGGTMTGALTLSGDPTSDLHAATKQYVDANGRAFVAEYGVTTSAEIEEAYQAGKAIYCKVTGDNDFSELYSLIKRQGATTHAFAHATNFGFTQIMCVSDSWAEASSGLPPATHASTHAADGTDPITPASIGAATEQYADSRVFTAVYGTTTLEEVKAAYNSGATVLCTRSDNSAKYILTGLSDTTAYFMGMGTSSQILYRVYLDTTWHAASFTCAASAHNQAASTVTAGTFAGQVVANSSGQTYSTSLLRNSKLVSAETNPTVNGEICWTYE